MTLNDVHSEEYDRLTELTRLSLPGTTTVDLTDIMVTLQRLESKLDTLAASHAETVGHVETLVQKVEPHLAELGPMIDAIASNPMFKMLTGGKKR
jgi:hypothetical protein